MTSPQGVLSPALPKDFVRQFRGEAMAMVAETVLPIPKIIQCNNKIVAPCATREWLEYHSGFVAIKSGTSYDDHRLWCFFNFNQAIDAHLRIALRHGMQELACIHISRMWSLHDVATCAHLVAQYWLGCLFQIAAGLEAGPSPLHQPLGAYFCGWAQLPPSIPRRILLWLGPAPLRCLI